MTEAAHRPAILTVDDEPTVLAAVSRDLRLGFGERYRILRSGSGPEALELLAELRRRGDPVALLIADQRMPGMEGTDYLLAARKIFPEAKRVLLTAYADTEAAIAAINEVGLDYYLLKPWDPPQEELFPIVEDLLTTWESGAAIEAGGVRVIGYRFSKDTHDLRDFMARNRVPGRWLDVERDGEARELLAVAGVPEERLPVALLEDGTVLERPTVLEFAERLGVASRPTSDHYDLVIVGGGPAGLAAAIYAAREGIDAVVVERSGLGGQAGVTERIDNYPGFPEGIGGADLAERFIAQARRYQVELLSAVSVEAISADASEAGDICLRLASGQEIETHATLIATGSSYRRLEVPGEDDLIGAGVHFCATCDGPFYRGADELLVIGGGNSALEEGLFLTKFAKRVRIVQREPELTASRLLQDKVNNDPRFVVHRNTEIVELAGKGRLESVRLRDRSTKEEQVVTPRAAFVFIGLDPNTAFLRGSVDLDVRGFVDDKGGFKTSIPGVFSAGDVRRGSTKQLGSAVGDGIAALIAAREYLQEHHEVARHAED